MTNERAYYEYKKIQFGILWAQKMPYARRYKLMQIMTKLITWGMCLDRQENPVQVQPRMKQLRLFEIAA